MINIHTLSILDDNYCYILEADNGDMAVIDPGTAKPVLEFLDAKDLSLSHILLTHHHGDHVGGLSALKAAYNCQVYGPAAEQTRISEMDHRLGQESAFSFGGERVEIIETPGHTLGQINYYFPQSALLFSGDTLFVMGCGRVFEGTTEQMHDSLQKLAALPENTKIYCGHEYTLANANFALSVEPENPLLQKRFQEVKMLRDQNRPTVPSTISEEKKTNLFLRAKTAKEFARLRHLKDAQ